MTPVERLIAIFRAEVGYIEKASNDQLDDKTANAGKGNWTKYARDLDALGDFYNGRKQGHDWCDVYVDWGFVQAFGKEKALRLLCAPAKSCGAGVKWSAMYYQQAGRFHEKNPRPGDQIFFGSGGSWWHTGFVLDVRDGRVYTSEGNTSSASGVIPNGGCVAEKSYSLTYANIKGYGRPDYSIVTDTEEEVQGMPDLNEIKQGVRAYRKELQDNDCAEWSKEAREWAVSVGLFAGDGSAEPNYMWEDFLTREQAAVLLYRFAKMAGLA